MNISKKITSVISALFLAYSLTGIILLILAFLVYKCSFSSAAVNIGIICIYILSCFSGGFLLGKKMKDRRFLWGILLGILYTSILILVSVICCHTFVFTNTGSISAIILCILSSMLGGMIS